MKKTLLAAALLAGYTGAAVAENTVTLYGRLSVGYAYDSIKVPSNNPALADSKYAGNTNNQFEFLSGYAPGSSNFGMKGTEDLGNGLALQFQLEGAIDMNQGSFSGFGRVAAVRLASDAWGTIGLGKDVNAGGAMTGGIDPFGAAWGIAAGSSTMGILGGRSNSMIRYTSPSFSGFQASVSYSSEGNSAIYLDPDTDTLKTAAETYGTSTKNRLLSTGVRYANGPITAVGAYNQAFVANNAGNTSPKTWLVGAAYDLKMVKLSAAYGQSIDGLMGNGFGATDKLGINGVVTDGVTGSIVAIPGARTNNWLIGASAPLGESGTLLVSFQQQIPGGDLDQGDEFATTSILGLGYKYSLSKRTDVWVSYNYGNNYAMLDGVKVNQAAVGLTHYF